MQFKKYKQFQYYRPNFLSQNYSTKNPRTNKNNNQISNRVQTDSNLNKDSSPDMMDSEKRLEASNEEYIPQVLYKSRSLIRTIKDNINDKYTPSQLVGDRTLSSALYNFSNRFGEEREPSPKTINVGDTKETIEYNIRTLNARKSPRDYEDFNPNQEMIFLESNESEPKNGSFDGRKYFGNNMSYLEKGPNVIGNRYSDNNSQMNLIDKNGVTYGNIYSGPPGGRIAPRGISPYQNFEEMNTSTENERLGTDDKKTRTFLESGNTTNDNRQNRFGGIGINNNMNNYSSINNNFFNNYNNASNMNMTNNNVNMSQVPTGVPKDSIQEKYYSREYENMTYKDVKRIVRKFTKVYDPSKNNNGLLVEESQITMRSANEDIFNNRYRVLSKMNKLSNILLARQRKVISPRKDDELCNNSDEISRENSDSYNKRTNRSFNRQSFEEKSKSPVRLPNRKSPENKFKYVSLAMISSKGRRTEDRIILRRMRFEKGGVVDLAQEERRRGKYQIRKVSRSPGLNKNFLRTNPKYRERAARYIQSWWKEIKELYSRKIQKIIKIQSVYRGRFVRKYLYDLLYLNYLYLSFCQKIEKVLKHQIKPYVFNILKNYGKKDKSQELKAYNLLKNIIASKAKKWRIITLRKYFNKWQKFLRNKEKLTLMIYKLMKLRVEKKNKNTILRDALRKWNYITKTLYMIQTFEEEKKTIIINYENDVTRINKTKEENTKKIKGLLRLLDGMNKYSKKSALEPTLPKLIDYLSKQRIIKLLKKIITRKIVDEKEKIKYYFYKYIKMTLKYIKNKINELPKKYQKEYGEDIQIEGEPEPEPKEPEVIIDTFELDKTREELLRVEILLKENETKKQKEVLLMKARIFLHIIKCIKDKQNKNILKKYFTKYFKKVIQLQRVEDRKKFEKKQKEEIDKKNKEIAKMRENHNLREIEIKTLTEKYKKIEIEKNREEEEKREYLERIEKYKIIITEEETKIKKKQINEKEIYKKLNKELNDKLKACQILNRYVLRRTHRYPLDAFKNTLSGSRKKHLLIKIIKIKQIIKKNILKKYFDKWRNKTFNKYRKENIRKLFIKILSIITNNFHKRLLQKKLYQWRKNVQQPKVEIIEPEPPTVYDTLKKVKDIVSFNDYLRIISIKKYGKDFLKRLKRTINPALKTKLIRKIVKKKIINNKRKLRRAFYKWKNNVDVENAIKILKTKLIFTLYDKNKNINQNNILQKFFNRWRIINTVEKIKSDITILKKVQKETKMITLKTIIRNKTGNNNHKILKKYLNKWRNVLKHEVPLLNTLSTKITKINIHKNGPDFINNLKKKRIIHKKTQILLKLIPKRVKNEKMLLYKYLLRWRNKIYGINTNNITKTYFKKIITMIIKKNDRLKLLKAFNKWRYGKEKVPVNAYLAAIKKIKTIICRKPFKHFVEYMNKTNPKKLRFKGQKIETIIEKIIKVKPYEKFIKNIKTIIRVKILKKIQPKVHETLKKYYLLKYFNKWKNIVKEQRIHNIKIITKWLKKKYDIEKDRKNKRRKELLKRIILTLIKEDRHLLKFALHFWRRITKIYADNDNARIIQKFCREILSKIKNKRTQDQKRLTNWLIKLYKKTVIRTVTNRHDVGEVYEYINTKKENIKRLRYIFDNRDKYNNRILLRLAILKWNAGKPKYDRSVQIIQKKIRQIISKKKLDNKRLLITILKHIIKTNENKNKDLIRKKFLQWYAIAKKINYRDTTKIEEFIRKIVVERLRRKLQTTLNKYSTKYFVYLLTNIAKINRLKNNLRKEPIIDAFNKIKNYIRRKNITKIMKIIVYVKDDKYKKLLLKEYFNKWRNKVKEIKDKEIKSIIIIQKFIRGKKVKKNVNKEITIKKILKQLIYRYDELTPLQFYFAKWIRITRRIICDENARIIQKFCRGIHDEYLRRLKYKNIEIYKKLVTIMITVGKNQKKDFFDKLRMIYRRKILEKLINTLVTKRKITLKEIFDKIKNSSKTRRRVVVTKIVTTFIKNKEKTKDNDLRTALHTWMYHARYRTIKENERIISEFCKDISRKIYITKKWHYLVNILKRIEVGYDIYEIYNRIKILMGLKKFAKTMKNKYKEYFFEEFKKTQKFTEIVQKVKIIIQNGEKNTKAISLRRYFDKWRNITKKIKQRLNTLNELMYILEVKQIKNDVNTMYDINIIKKIKEFTKYINKVYLINALRRIKKYVDNKNKNKKLANDLINAKKDINHKNKKIPIIKKLYKIYTYKVFERLFNRIETKYMKKTKIVKKIFIEKIINNYYSKTKEYTYSSHIQNENKPYTKRILFKTKKKTQPKTTRDKSQIYLSLTSILVKLIKELIQKRKKESLDKIKERYNGMKLIQALNKFIYNKRKQTLQELIERLRVLIDIYENDGPRQAKLFKLFRKVVIKKLFIYKEEVYRINKLFYLINLTVFNKEIAKARWIRQMIRKWRFITFMRKMAKKKMELMYKNLHVSYLEMANTIFSDTEKINPSVVKEFERFGYGVGMFVNEDPYKPREGKNCLGVKKKYLFPPVELEKTYKITKKVVEKEVKKEEYMSDDKGQYVSGTGRMESKHSKTMIDTGKEEYDYDEKRDKYKDYAKTKKDYGKDTESKSKTQSKLKAHYSTKPKEK